jgi:phage-related protein
VVKPKFLWQPVYNSPINNEPKVNAVSFGDGYESRSRAGINNNLISMDCLFEGKSLQEGTSILHFLYARQGVESFVFTAPRPFNFPKLFVCQQWSADPVFYDSYRIQGTFREVVN